jgi:hypothetical protein
VLGQRQELGDVVNKSGEEVGWDRMVGKVEEADVDDSVAKLKDEFPTCLR